MLQKKEIKLLPEKGLHFKKANSLSVIITVSGRDFGIKLIGNCKNELTTVKNFENILGVLLSQESLIESLKFGIITSDLDNTVQNTLLIYLDKVVKYYEKPIVNPEEVFG